MTHFSLRGEGLGGGNLHFSRGASLRPKGAYSEREANSDFEDLKLATCTLRDLNRIDRVLPGANNWGPLGPSGPTGTYIEGLSDLEWVHSGLPGPTRAYRAHRTWSRPNGTFKGPRIDTLGSRVGPPRPRVGLPGPKVRPIWNTGRPLWSRRALSDLERPSRA